MYIIYKIKEDVSSFRVIDDNLLKIKGGSLYRDELYIDDRVDSYNYSLYNNKVLYLKNKQTFIDNRIIDRSILINTVFKNFALFSYGFDVKDFTLRYQFIDLDSGEVVFDLGRHSNLKSSFIWDETSLALNIGNKTSCFSAANEFSQEWEIDIALKNILGLFNEKLLVVVDEHTILQIDPFSGDILYKWSDLPGFEAGTKYKGKIPNASNFVLDKESAKLIGVFYTYYFEIDLRSKKISFYQLKDELSKYGISDFRPFNNNPFTQEHLFLTAHTYWDDFPNVDLSSVIALNRESKKVDWSHTFTESGLGTNIPQITTTHLYQKDLDNNLHIFERQDQLA